MSQNLKMYLFGLLIGGAIVFLLVGCSEPVKRTADQGPEVAANIPVEKKVDISDVGAEKGTAAKCPDFSDALIKAKERITLLEITNDQLLKDLQDRDYDIGLVKDSFQRQITTEGVEAAPHMHIYSGVDAFNEYYKEQRQDDFQDPEPYIKTFDVKDYGTDKYPDLICIAYKNGKKDCIDPMDITER